MTKNFLTWAAYLAAIIFVIIAIVYFSTSADQLPSFIPGHEAGEHRTHVKHAIAAILLAAACAVFGWFQSGPKRSAK